MTQLSVNVNKIATLRNARGGNNPDLLALTRKIISYGAEGITIHPRPDGRHIRKQDAYDLANMVTVELNMEGYPDEHFLQMVGEIKPAQCTLVPDSPEVLTSNAGWNLRQNLELLKKTVGFLKDKGIRTALFIDPNHMPLEDYPLLQEIGTDRVELYTEQYATNFFSDKAAETLALYKNAGKMVTELGVALNAGHDLDCNNLPTLVKAIPEIQEVSIGHALICDSLEWGLQETVKRYLACCKG